MKRMVCLAPILALSDFDASAPPFVLDTDASHTAVSSVLTQMDMTSPIQQLQKASPHSDAAT
ncbi:hypothetical protein EGR_07147 [Echinococcus granulosus]|uniref:Reverse transcriptase/retrotransposon-derived protein RNase H-like domain-containing protein n=1 Tax=Echinococcus granulosus TaxID=6210 RepID=W6UA82_ECHGR|nr:hypothetical protein EGR_07147 [Echinococcus granulosus]EUB57955.1 hypothetical protein EGR_07147 [Echinococcus granulosus]